MFESGVGAHAAGPGDVSQAAEGAGVVAGQHGGAREAVGDDGVVQRQLGDLGEVGGDGPQLRGVGQRMQRDAPGRMAPRSSRCPSLRR